MKKNLRAKIEAMDKAQLIDVIEQMCNVPETEKLLKLMLAPSQTDIDRALRKFSSMCDYYVSDSCSSRAGKAMYEAAEPLYAAYKYADVKLGAYIIYGMHEAMEENDLLDIGGDDYYNIVGDLLGDLEDALKNSPQLFTKAEFVKYSGIVELDD